MAAEGEAVDYETDPEDSLLPSAMRRREASDDDNDGKPAPRGRPAPVVGEELDGQGAAPGEEDDEEFDSEEEGGGSAVPESGPGGWADAGEREEGENPDPVEEGERKEDEVSAVPTSGAFYMHDDRLRENGRGRRRRIPGPNNLWESKDNQAWVHDRFEELNLQDARYDEESRATKGRLRGRRHTKMRGTDAGYVRGNVSRAYDVNNNQNSRSHAYDDGNNHNRLPRTVRGRGPRRYDTLVNKNAEISATQNKRYAKGYESTSTSNTGRQSSHSANLQPEQVLPHGHVFASSLSSASPPFYPSRSTNKDASQPGIINKNNSSSVKIVDNFSAPQRSSQIRGKPAAESDGRYQGYVADSVHLGVEKSKAGSRPQASASPSSPSPTQYNSRTQGGPLNVSRAMNHQSAIAPNHIRRASGQSQAHAHQKSVQTPVQATFQFSTQQTCQLPENGSHQGSSPPQTPLGSSSDVGETRSLADISKSNSQLVEKGKISNQGGNSPFLYSGVAQVLGAAGAMGLSQGDHNFPASPALLSVMQFGGQHHGGVGVPAFGMAVPGYVARPGFGNSEMTYISRGEEKLKIPVAKQMKMRLPLLADAGALGASYCSPYISLDNSFHAHTSGQASSLPSPRVNGKIKPANTGKSLQEADSVSDEFGQRQSKPRRQVICEARCALNHCSRALGGSLIKKCVICEKIINRSGQVEFGGLLHDDLQFHLKMLSGI